MVRIRACHFSFDSYGIYIRSLRTAFRARICRRSVICFVRPRVAAPMNSLSTPIPHATFHGVGTGEAVWTTAAANARSQRSVFHGDGGAQFGCPSLRLRWIPLLGDRWSFCGRFRTILRLPDGTWIGRVSSRFRDVLGTLNVTIRTHYLRASVRAICSCVSKSPNVALPCVNPPPKNYQHEVVPCPLCPPDAHKSPVIFAFVTHARPQYVDLPPQRTLISTHTSTDRRARSGAIPPPTVRRPIWRRYLGLSG